MEKSLQRTKRWYTDYHSTNVIISSTGKGGLAGAPGHSLGYDGEYGESGILNATHYGF